MAYPVLHPILIISEASLACALALHSSRQRQTNADRRTGPIADDEHLLLLVISQVLCAATGPLCRYRSFVPPQVLCANTGRVCCHRPGVPPQVLCANTGRVCCHRAGVLPQGGCAATGRVCCHTFRCCTVVSYCTVFPNFACTRTQR
jgi:hypothetical protein